MKVKVELVIIPEENLESDNLLGWLNFWDNVNGQDKIVEVYPDKTIDKDTGKEISLSQLMFHVKTAVKNWHYE